MITVTSNIGTVTQVLAGELNDLAQTDKLLRTCATSVLDLMKKRVHRDGVATDGQPIGTYSPGYMKVRTGGFLNASRISRGKNKGNLKDAGVFTRGAKKGSPRPKYNRGPETKVIASLTREMENDMKVFPTDNGYAIGYSNEHNYDKSQWVTAHYRAIFELSAGEEQAVNTIVENAFPR